MLCAFTRVTLRLFYHHHVGSQTEAVQTMTLRACVRLLHFLTITTHTVSICPSVSLPSKKTTYGRTGSTMEQPTFWGTKKVLLSPNTATQRKISGDVVDRRPTLGPCCLHCYKSTILLPILIEHILYQLKIKESSGCVSVLGQQQQADQIFPEWVLFL